VGADRDAAGYADDRTLVAALRGGDEAAFALLFDRHDRALRRLARTFVATQAAADEVVQETWLAVVEGIDRFEGRSSLRTWITRILMNRARTRGVRDKRSVPFSSVADPTFPPDRFLPPEQVEARETLDRVQAAIEDLPSLHRRVITLRDVDGWSPHEVCAVLDLTPGNQRVVLHRARARVRAALEAYLTGTPA
jgi:RNA polymerase sigma-70 factor (ECF subfamily)